MADSPKVPLLNKPGVKNWTERYNALGGKTNWIRRTAEHLQGKGMVEGIAIATAVNAAQKMCQSGDTNLPGVQQVNAGSRAEACAAYAQWVKAKREAEAARATNLTASEAYDALHAIDLTRSFIAYEALERRSLPPGASAAYLELAEPSEGEVDLAFRVDEPRGFHGRWTAMSGTVKKLASRDNVFLSEHQHDTIASHALAHGEPTSVTKGIGSNVVVKFANGQLHSYGAHGGSERLDNVPPSGGPPPPLSSAERQAIVAEEVRNARKAIAPNIPGDPPSYSGAQLAAIKGIARKNALRRIDSHERRASHGMALTSDDGAVVDLANFIDAAVKKPGQLHRDLGVPAGKKIPRKRIVAALSHSDPKVRARARLALRLIAMREGTS